MRSVIEMAREAGWKYADGDDGYEPLWRFAALVREDEREACAKEGWMAASSDCEDRVAAAIRARGNSET